jgi:hypothetical protein
MTQKYHFIAVGGVGMSGLAKYLLQEGFEVSGSDISESKYTKQLVDLGGKIYIGHDKKNVPNNAIIVVSSAIRESNVELIKAREYFYKSKLDMNFFTGSTLFTWAGTKVNRTIALICKLRLQKSPEYNYIYVGGIYFNDIAQIMSQPKPRAEELAALIPRSSKEKQKFDKYLSDHLMNIEYASTYLNVDKAWHELEKQALSGGYKEPETVVKPKVEKEGPKLEKYDFRHIQDISNVKKYSSLSDPLHNIFYGYLKNSDLGCNIEVGTMFTEAPAHAMPINFLLSKGDTKVAVLLMDGHKTKRYSVLETEALCKENGVSVLRFFFEYGNEEEYVIDRIRKSLN